MGIGSYAPVAIALESRDHALWALVGWYYSDDGPGKDERHPEGVAAANAIERAATAGVIIEMRPPPANIVRDVPPNITHADNCRCSDCEIVF